MLANLCNCTDELFKVHRLKPTKDWKQQFDNYLKNTPLYYAVVSSRTLGLNKENCHLPEWVARVFLNCHLSLEML